MEQNKLSKSALLTEILANHELLDAIGSAWRLFFHLVLVAKGCMVGTYDEIGEAIGMNNGRTIRNWVNQLEKHGILRCQSKGKRVEVKLLEPHLAIAQASDQPLEQVEVPEYLKNDKIKGLLKMYEGAEMMGSGLELKAIIHAGNKSN